MNLFLKRLGGFYKYRFLMQTAGAFWGIFGVF